VNHIVAGVIIYLVTTAGVFKYEQARIFTSKKNFQIPLRIKWPSLKRYIGGSRGGRL